MDNQVKKTMASHIKMLRLMRGLTQQDVAQRLHKTTNAISNWELGNTSPPIDDMVELCKIYQVTPNQLCGWDECPELIEYIKTKENVSSKIEELQREKKEIENRIKKYMTLLDRNN